MARSAVLEAISRDEQLRRLRDLAERAMVAFGHPGARLTLREHKQNTTFRAVPEGASGDEGFLLRIAMAGRYPPSVIRGEMFWLRALAQLGAPQPQATTDGCLVAELPLGGEAEPRCCILFRWLPGRSLGRSIEPQRAAAIGELLGRLHRRAERFTPPPDFERPRWDLDRLLGGSEVLPAERLPAGSEALLPARDRALLEEAGAAVRRTVAALGEGPEVFGLIHTDLEPDNVVLDDEILRPIDFEHCGWGHYLYDVGASLLALADQQSFPALRRAFLEGYQRRRPLPAAQLALIDTFLLLRSLFSLRLTFLETWDLPGVREDARSLVPFMLGGIRRLLASGLSASGVPAAAETPAAVPAADLRTLNTVRFLARLRSRGIRLRAEDEQLRFSAPKGALTPALRDELKTRKSEILDFLKQSAASRGSSLPPVRKVPREAGRSLPLSFAQNRLWFIDQMNPGNAAYNIPAAVRVEGQLDIALLERAFNEVVRRHEVLRTAFGTETDGEPRQIIATDLAIPLAVADLSRLSVTMREAEARRATMAEALLPFDLATGPLVRAALLYLDEGDHLLLFTLHHIVTDAWSTGILVRELAALYEAFSNGAPSPLGELPVQYADFAQWQREILRGEALEDQLAYWRRQLEGVPDLLELPTDRPRPSVQDWRGGRRRLAWPAALRDRLGELAKGYDVTLFMTLVAAYSALLGRTSGQRTVSVGTPIAGRGRREVEGLIGFFVNTLVLSNDLSGDPSFAELLARTRRVTLQAYQFQDLPFERLVEELQPQRSLSHTPLFQAALVFQNVPRSSARFPGLTLRRLPSVEPNTHFDLTLGLEEASEGLQGSLRYRQALFDATTIRRLADHLGNFLKAVSKSPETRLSEIPLLATAERHQLLREWNDTMAAASRHSSVLPLIEAQAAHRGEAVALIFGEQQLAFAHLMVRANQLAHDLVARGVGTGDLVGIYAERCPELVISVLAIWKAGGAYLPLDPKSPPKRRRAILEDARLDRVLIAGAAAGSPVAGSPVAETQVAWPERTTLVRVDGHCWAFADHPTTAPNILSGAESPAYVIYTSGSTGTPKGVVVSHAGIPGLAAAQVDRMGLGPGFRVLQFASLGFDASLSEIVMALTSGATLVLARDEERSDRPLRDMLIRERVTHATLPPVVLPTLEDEGQPPGRGLALDTLLVAGEACSGEVVGRWSSSLRMINAYGPTETTVCATMSAPLSGTGTPPIGRPIWNLRVQVLDAVMTPVPVGVVGELHVAGAGLAQGYQGRADLTAERFVADPGDPSRSKGGRMYRTGDLARWRADGTLEFVGRADRQVKLRGFRIEPGEIEAAVRSHEAVRDNVVTVYGETPEEERLVAYVVPESGEEPPPTGDLRAFLAEQLPDYMVPSNVVFLEALPVTANGKVDRRALPALQDLRPTPKAPSAPPRTAMERKIAELWQEILKVDEVGRHDSFFDLGGHSLLIARVRTRLASELGREIPIVEMFRFPTVSSLAEHLAGDSALTRVATEIEEEERSEKRKQGMNRLRRRLERVRQ